MFSLNASFLFQLYIFLIVDIISSFGTKKCKKNVEFTQILYSSVKSTDYLHSQNNLRNKTIEKMCWTEYTSTAAGSKASRVPKLGDDVGKALKY